MTNDNKINQVDGVYGDVKKASTDFGKYTMKTTIPEQPKYPSGGLTIFDMIADEVAKPKYDLTDNGKGKKYDTGKSMVGTLLRVFPNALWGVGECIEFGTHKYPDPNNWKKVENAKFRYLDSAIRHLLSHYKGITYDSETGKPHLAHCAWNILAILELFYMEKNTEKSNEA